MPRLNLNIHATTLKSTAIFLLTLPAGSFATSCSIPIQTHSQATISPYGVEISDIKDGIVSISFTSDAASENTDGIIIEIIRDGNTIEKKEVKWSRKAFSVEIGGKERPILPSDRLRFSATWGLNISKGLFESRIPRKIGTGYNQAEVKI